MEYRYMNSINFAGSSVDGFKVEPGENICKEVTPYHAIDNSVAEEGGQLFEHFVFDRIKNSDVPSIKLADTPGTPVRMSRPELMDAAARLCELATSFAETDERRRVRDTAFEINANITCQDLATILLTMMTNSHHLEEGIVVLFFFCFDLSVRMLESGLRDFWEFIAWCKDAIVLAAGPHVQAYGGWSKVLQVAAGGSALLGAIATGVFVLARVGVGALLFL